MESTFWKPGEITELAHFAGMSVTNLSSILHRRRGVSVDRAKHLEALTAEAFGEEYRVPWQEWVDNRESTHPAFFPKEG